MPKDFVQVKSLVEGEVDKILTSKNSEQPQLLQSKFVKMLQRNSFFKKVDS